MIYLYTLSKGTFKFLRNKIKRLTCLHYFFKALYHVVLIAGSTSLYADQSNEDIFTEIYRNKVWGENDRGEGCSGSGAKLETTEEYRNYLQIFFKENDIRSVVDVGCGDWAWSWAIDWSNIDYYGYDVVKSLIQNNQAKYSQHNIQFIHGDATLIDLPAADLLLCKDVLQHLPLEDIYLLIEQFHKFKYCIIQNDVDYLNGKDPNHNGQILRGNGRSLDLTEPPFSLRGEKVLTYQEKDGMNIKQITLFRNQE